MIGAKTRSHLAAGWEDQRDLIFESANRGRLVTLASHIITGKYFSVIEKLLLIFWLNIISMLSLTF